MDKQWHACERKKRYKSEVNAEKEVKRIKKTGKIIDNYNIYKCRYCEGYHLGHNKGR